MSGSSRDLKSGAGELCEPVSWGRKPKFVNANLGLVTEHPTPSAIFWLCQKMARE
ncbi:MAG: hypothetical protein NTW04_05250 [Elusimicrobia bacterium]|nr:hypothetical protein [Elusimicrobiota bacterium]